MSNSPARKAWIEPSTASTDGQSSHRQLAAPAQCAEKGSFGLDALPGRHVGELVAQLSHPRIPLPHLQTQRCLSHTREHFLKRKAVRKEPVGSLRT